jgi:formate--tetrahydrofolate ligase
MHGGCHLTAAVCEDIKALKDGFSNLDKHVENIRKFGVPMVVAINHFQADSEEEIAVVREHCRELGARCALSMVFEQGGEGGQELASQVIEVLENESSHFRFLYDVHQPLKEKIAVIATEIYGAKHVEYETAAQRHLKAIEESGLGNLMVCMAKTQLSITDKPNLKGAPRDWELTVREIFVSAGAGFVVPMCGRIMLIPGLPSQPSALNMDIDEDGNITGLN